MLCRRRPSRPLAALLLGAALPLAALGPAAMPGPAQAQTQTQTDARGPVSLVADRLDSAGRGQIAASGNVVVLYGDVRLTASRLSYDQGTDQLRIDGPITLTKADGSVVILASAAELSMDLSEGIMRSARMVLDQQMQIAAAELSRIGGRYTRATRIVASSCEICAARPTPLWDIRAREVVHDTETRQLYYDNAQFRVLGVPVFWLPRLRMPDPTLDRATGFLAPRLSTSTRLGYGLRVPYFLRLGDHADLTVTPFITTKSNTLELRYRQAFTKGDLALTAALSDDTLLPDHTRWFLFGDGRFQIGRGFTLDFGLEQVSDASYLSDYSYSDADRLESYVELWRVKRDELSFAGLKQYETLRADELAHATELPFGQAEFMHERRFDMLGGSGFWQISADAYWRESDDPDPGRGRDGARISAAGEWHRDWLLAGGLLAELRGRIDADLYWTGQDSDHEGIQSHLTPTAALTLRYPMSRHGENGTLDVIEPVLQLAWTDRLGATPTNEDSTLVEFDETNLFSLNRFPGQDVHERGTRAALGLTWTRLQPGGWSYTLAAGRVWHRDDLGQFSAVSGLSGTLSDWLIAGQAQLGDRFAIQGRALLGDDAGLRKSELLAMYQSDRISLTTGYTWVDTDTIEERTIPINEWRWDSTFQLSDNWKARADWRYNLDQNDITKAGLGLEYSNECVTVDLSLSRRFTSSTSVKQTTNIGLGVSLNGIGGKRGSRGRACAR